MRKLSPPGWIATSRVSFEMSTPTLWATVDLIFFSVLVLSRGHDPRVSVQAAGKREGWSNYSTVLSDWGAIRPVPSRRRPVSLTDRRRRSCWIRRENDKTRRASRLFETVAPVSARDRARLVAALPGLYPARKVRRTAVLPSKYRRGSRSSRYRWQQHSPSNDLFFPPVPILPACPGEPTPTTRMERGVLRPQCSTCGSLDARGTPSLPVAHSRTRRSGVAIRGLRPVASLPSR
jgi:hypothetical protein